MRVPVGETSLPSALPAPRRGGGVTDPESASWEWSPDSEELRWHEPMRAVLGMPEAAADDVREALRQLLGPILLAPRCPGEVIDLEHTLHLPRRADRRFKIHGQWMAGYRATSAVLGGTVTDITHANEVSTPAELRDRYRLLVELSPDAIVVHCDGEIVFANRAAVEIVGRESVDDLLGHSILSFVAPESHSGLLQRIASMRETDTYSEPSEAFLVRADGTYVLVESTSVRTSWADKPAFQAILRDLTDQKAARQANARYSAAVEALDEGLLIIDVDDRVETANPAALLLLANPGLIGQRFSSATQLLDEDGDPLTAAMIGLDEARQKGTSRPAFTASLKRPDGRTTYLSVSIRSLPTETGEGPFPVVMCLLDVSERHAAAELLRFEARHDHATGLANRNLVLETIGELLSAPDMTVGVLFIDLDRFKMVNDSLGHDAGDAVLRTIARRLAYEAPAESTVGRLAGDEFIVVLPGATVEDAQALGARLLTRLGEPVRIMRRDLVVTGSIGIVVTEPGVGQGVGGRKDVGATDVLRDADVAMYYAKQHGRNRLATFDERFRRRAIDRLALEEELRHGLATGELHPAYQPIVALDTLAIAAVEALARWTHPQRGAVPPTVFIPIAEETGLIAPLGRLMLGRATQQVAMWRESCGISDLVMSVNLSPRQLADPHVADRVSELLAARRLPASALTLEITESALMDDPELAAETLKRLRNLGVGISVDDFGTGYSSLSYLRRFPVTA